MCLRPVLIITGRAADIIISVVAKCHVHHATMAETFYIRDILPMVYPFSMPSMTAFFPAFSNGTDQREYMLYLRLYSFGNHLLFRSGCGLLWQ